MSPSTVKRTVTTALCISAAIIGYATASIAGEDASPSAEHKVDIRDFLYNPDSIKVKVGDTVTWTNHDIVPHTATLSASDVGTGPILLSNEGSLEMQASGTLTYHCRYHPEMQGEILVE